MLLRNFCTGLALCFALMLGAAASEAAETTDVAAWGPYARLVDSTQQSDVGYRVHWHWTEPGRKLAEDWYEAYSGELSYTTTIVPGAQRGQLVLESPKFGHKIWNGTVSPDGRSVLYVGVGMLKAPYRVDVDAEGRMAMTQVRLKGAEVVDNFSTQYDHADARGLIVRPNAKPADPKLWGVYSRLLGARLAGKMWSGISWYWLGEDRMIEDRGVLQRKLQIEPDGAGGLTMSAGKPGESWSGRIGADGEVVWTSKDDAPFRTRIDGDEVVIEGVALKDGVVVKAKSATRYRGHLSDGVIAGGAPGR